MVAASAKSVTLVSEVGLVEQCALVIRVGGLSAVHMVLIATSLTQECLVGADFLSQQGCAAKGVVCGWATGAHVYKRAC